MLRQLKPEAQILSEILSSFSNLASSYNLLKLKLPKFMSETFSWDVEIKEKAF